MDTNNKSGKEEKENILMVILNELSEGQKVNTKATHMLAATVKDYTTKVKEHIESSKNEHTDISFTKQLDGIEENLEEIKILISRLAETKQQKRFLFFPEHNAKEYYGTILRWVLYIVIATYGFLLLRYLIDVLGK